MDEDNRSEPAVRDVDIMTSDDITTTVTQLANSISSSKSEDDELERTTRVMESEETQPRLESHMEDIVAAYDDHEFKLHFRISRSTFEYILAIITPKLKSSQRFAIPPKQQLFITLSIMVTSDSGSSISDRFYVTIQTIYNCIRRVIKALFDLAPSIITWPSGNNVNMIWDGFKNISGFPNVIGVVGSTLITIPSSTVFPDVFYDQDKEKYFIQLQAVCDHTGRFIHCFTDCPGSMTRQEVFKSSELQKWLGNDEKFPANCYILGDATYKLHENVIVPYHVNGDITLKHQNFNVCHSVARRAAVEKAFNLLKTRFHSIKIGLTQRKLDSISMFVTACCVIHNICLSREDEIDYDLIDDTAENKCFHGDTASSEQALDKRDLICAMLPMKDI